MNDGELDLRVADLILGNAQNILREHNNIRQFAWGERPLDVLFKGCIGDVDCVGPQRVQTTHSLIAEKYGTVIESSGNRGVVRLDGGDVLHRCVRSIRYDCAALHEFLPDICAVVSSLVSQASQDPRCV